MARRPTVTLVAAFVAVYLVELVAIQLGVGRGAFALALPLSTRPWTVLTSVLAHANFWHLASNAVALIVVGLFLERRTSPARFYAFFLLAGVLSGLAEVFVGAALGDPVSVLGASGGVLAVTGYLLSGNRVADVAVGGVAVGWRAGAVTLVAIAAVVTVVTARANVALVAHFTGLLLGLVSGRLHLLRAR